ncbi:AMP-binding protein [Lunatibacter salilacus]|uniref:AMP-binding protein n=1 Tax=Lunatibacter salilacus TaxID=2483804 RepID=UPI00131D3EB1|nr:AMP-binding protein [Lunatibacter salilacus]
MLERNIVMTDDSTHYFDDIKAGKWARIDPAFYGAMEFCQKWLNGEKSFTLKTSGSTGPPKDITVSREQMILSARATKSFLKLRKGCRMICCLNTDMIAGKMMLVRAMEWEALIYLLKPSATLVLPFNNVWVDFTALVPLQLQASLENKASRALLNQIGTIIIGGAPTSPELREKASKLPGKIYQTFGMTETVSHIAMADLKAEGPLIYKVLPRVNLKVDAAKKLIIEAPMSGYKRIKTQDVVDLIDNKTFIWKGRADFVINSGGVKLYPDELEAAVDPHWRKYFPGKRFFITSASDPKLGESVLLVCERVSSKDPFIQPFLHTLYENIHPYWMPKRLLNVDTILLTPSGKIDKRATLKPYV